MKLGIVACLVFAACQSVDVAPEPLPSLRVARLRCEHKVEPLGIDERAPHFDWRDDAADPSERGVAQTAYQIMVATDGRALAFERPDLWDSGRVNSSATREIEYAGKPLTSNGAVFWKVRVWDQKGVASRWSDVAHFSTGLFDPEDWHAQWIGWDAPLAAKPEAQSSFEHAQWIWFGADPATPPKGDRWFRGVWTVPENANNRTAKLSLAVDNHYDLYLNGEKLDASHDDVDAWRSGKELDLSAKLHRGANVIAIAANNATDSPAGVLARLVVDEGASDELSFASDATWRAVDHLDAHWLDANFDDSTWPAVKVLGEYGIEPWGKIRRAALVLPPPRYLRKTFGIDSDIARATLFATALGLYRVEIDGQPVSEDYFTPGWTDYEKRVEYQTYDVTAMLQRGENAIGVILADGWYAGYVGYGGHRNHYGDKTRARVELVVEHRDGTRTIVASDGSWRASTGPLVEADFLMGETCHAGETEDGWTSPHFDGTRWAAVDVTPKINAVCRAFPGVPVRVYAALAPRTIREVGPDTYVLDLGQNIAGVAKLRLRGAPGQTIVLRYAERLNPDGTIYTANLRGARAIDTYVCRGGREEVWQPRFTFHGFQYIEIRGLGHAPSADTVTALALSSATPMAGSFDCSDPMIERLFQNTWWTQHMNFIDVPTDCPQRDERLGWTGDAQVYIRTANYIADAQSFYTKWLLDLEDAQREDGQFPMVAPLKVAGSDGGPAWADAGVVCPWTVYDVYGDRRLLEQHFESMKRYVDFCEKRSVDLLPPENFHCFGDWVAIKADTPKEVIFESYFAGSARLVAMSADVLGRAEDSQRYWKLYQDVKSAFQRAYIDADGIVKGDTQCGYVLALAFDLVDGELRDRVGAHLVERIAERDWHLSTGFVGTKDLMLVLAKIGRNDVAYKLLFNTTFPSWGFTIVNGATSIWERWDGWTPEKGFQDPGMNSFAHYSFGAVTQWLFENVGGIRPAASGFTRVDLAPEPGGELTWAKVSYESPNGRIESHWRLEGDALELDVAVPPNTSALLHVPTSRADSLTEGGRAIDALHTVRGAKFVGATRAEVQVELASGHYHFACKSPVVRRLDVGAH